MKNTFYLILLIFVLAGCEKDESDDMSKNVIEYPISFTINDIEFGESKLFEVKDASIEEINFAGIFTQFDPQLQLDLTVDFIGFPFNKFELLSESEIKLFISDNTVSPSDTIFPYTKNGSLLNIIIDETTNESFNLDFDEVNLKLKYCLLSYFHSFQNSFTGQVDYSALGIEECTTKDYAENADNVLIDNSLMVNDTIAINLSDLIFD